MIQKQISIFIENRSGRLAEVVSTVSEMGINIKALSVADTTHFGILRIIVDDPDEVVARLKNINLAANTAEVLTVEVPNTPGSAAEVLKKLTDAKLSVEYMYSIAANADKATLVISVDCPTAGEKALNP